MDAMLIKCSFNTFYGPFTLSDAETCTDKICVEPIEIYISRSLGSV